MRPTSRRQWTRRSGTCLLPCSMRAVPGPARRATERRCGFAHHARQRVKVDWDAWSAMPEPAIETVNLFKQYRGRPVVRDLSFTVRPGEVYALVGPNGAGKTTVIRLVSGLAYPSGGEVRLLGGDPHADGSVRARLGAMVEAPAAFYPYLRG